MKAVNRCVQGVLAIVLWCCFSLASAEVITQNRTVEADDLSLENLAVVIDGVTLTINGAHRFASLELKNGATLTHSVEVEAKLDLFIDGLLRIDSSSFVNANARGNARSGSAHSYVGGSYGGRGGFYSSNQSVEEFGSYASPTDYGVGGSAGRGGGAIKLTAGELKLDGRIQANGSNASGHGGGSSGGSVWLKANTLSGAGSISADGGNARSGYSGSGGGGGRVAVSFGQNDGFNLDQITAWGGVKGSGSSMESAGPGTVYLVDETHQSRELRVVGQDRTGRTTVISGENEALSAVLVKKAQAEFRSEEVASGAAVSVDDGRLFLSGAHTFDTLSLVTNAVLSHPAEAAEIPEIIVNGTASIDETSLIDVTSRGRSKPADRHQYVGGSYGGPGGYYSNNQSVAEFGSYSSPMDYGVGGSTGRGGGAVRLTAGELKLDGRIQANGSNASGHGGGSSGGSVWLKANILSGAGSISADGGNARSGYSGSGGGGGRVAVSFGQNDGFNLDQITAWGGVKGSGSSMESAGAGTVYLVDETHRSRELRVGGQDRTGRTTVIPRESEVLSAVLVKKAQAVFRSEELTLGGVLTVDNGRLFLSGAHTLDSLELLNSGVLTHPVEVEEKLDVTVTGTANIDETIVDRCEQSRPV